MDEEEDVYQVALQQSSVDNDDDYVKPTLIDLNSSVEVPIVSFKCSYEQCDKDFHGEECNECNEIGIKNQCFCLQHQSHDFHNQSKAEIRENNKRDGEDESFDNAGDNNSPNNDENQRYIYNQLRCITEVSC